MQNNKIEIRQASEKDSIDIWKWRNDPITRKMFYSSEIVSWEDHSK